MMRPFLNPVQWFPHECKQQYIINQTFFQRFAFRLAFFVSF